MAGDLRISMLIEANAQRAKAEVASMREEVSQLAGAGQQAGAGMEAAGAGAAEWGSAVQMLRASVQPLVVEAQELAHAAGMMAAAEEAGAISAHQAAVAHDAFARAAIDLQARMDALGVTLDGETASMRQQDTVLQQLIARTTGMNRATDESIADHLRHGQALDQLRARFDPLFAVSRQYELALEEIAEAERLGAISANTAAAARDRLAQSMAPAIAGVDQLGRSSQVSGHYAAQLSYQLNDIGMMMAMGQSPFLLMVQQGPQVVQVFAAMRLAGISLGVALRSALGMLINPMSLATLAVIGFGAAAVQWFASSAEEAVSLEDAVSDLASAIDAYDAAAKAARASTADLRKEFGENVEAAQAYLRELELIEKREAERAARAAMSTLRSAFGGDQASLAEQFGVNFRSGEGARIVNDVRSALSGVDGAVGLEAQIDALERLRVAMAAAAAADGRRTAAEDEALRQINELLLDQIALRERIAENSGAGEKGNLVDLQQLIDLRRTAAAQDQAWAQETLATLTAENEIRALIAVHGKDSAIVAAARANAEREVFAALVDSRDVSEDVKDQLLSAYDAANSIASVNIAARIEAALGPAAALASRLWDAARAAAAAAGAGRTGAVSGRGPAFEDRGRSGSTMPDYIAPAPTLEEVWNQYNPPATGGGSSGGSAGTSEITKQRDALQTLIDEQERQIALLRTTDPAQRIILENHEALANATEAEKEKVIGLIQERERLEKVADALDQIKQTGGKAFVDLATGAASFGDALTMVLDQMAQMAASSLWDMFWGGTGNGDGGLSGLLASWLGLPAKADGGRVIGAGGPRDDKILTRLSNGEYVVNAAAAAEHLTLLEAINGGASLSDLLAGLAGARPIALADGGYVGALNGSSAPAGWISVNAAVAAGNSNGTSQRQRPLVQIINQSAEPIREAPGDGPDVEETVKLIVGRQMARGNFDQQQRARYGVSPEVAKR